MIRSSLQFEEPRPFGSPHNLKAIALVFRLGMRGPLGGNFPQLEPAGCRFATQEVVQSGYRVHSITTSFSGTPRATAIL
jgi:hypothetical protein